MTESSELNVLRKENAALRTELEFASRRFSALRDVGRALTGKLSLEGLLQAVVGQVSSLTDCDRATFFVVDHDAGELWSVVAEGLDQEAVEIRIPIGGGIAGEVAATATPLNLAEVYNDPRFDASVDERTGYRTETLLCVPVKDDEGKAMGVIEAINKRRGVFSEQDERLLEAVAHQLSVALDNAFLFETLRDQAVDLERARESLQRRVSELDLLSALDGALAQATDVEATAEVIVRRACALMDADAASLANAAQSAKARFRGTVRGSDEVISFDYPRDRGVIGRVVATGWPRNVEDARQDPAHDPELAKKLGLIPGPLLVVPLEVNGKSLGAMEVMRAPERPRFDSEDARFLTLIAARVAIALDAAQRRAEAQKDEALRTIGTMLAGIIHDFKTPMTVIAGYVELMVECEAEDERRASAETVLRNTDMIVSMTTELLRFARGDSAVLLRKVYLARFGQEVEEMIKSLVGELPISVESKIDFTGVIRADDVRLKRAIVNLATNSVEAMSTKGSRLQFGIRRADDAVEFVVEDDGPGIPPEIEPTLFESFSTFGKDNGTGLGLALVQKIVTDHGGRVDVDNRPGEGVRFTLSLPA